MATATARKIAPLAGLLLLTGALLATLLGPAASPAGAQTASASGCSGVTLTPSSRTVRRGGRVLVTGRSCSGGSAASASAGSVRIKMRKGRRWASVANVAADSTGEFEVCVPVRVPARARTAQLQASSTSGSSSPVSVQVSSKGSASCQAGGGNAGTGRSGSVTGSGTRPTPPPPPPPPPPGTLLRQDPATNPDPMPLWNEISAQSASRHQQFSSGGPGGSAFRRMTVQDGDDSWGERAELGYNSRMNGLGAPWGTFFLYNQGERRVTDFSMRLPTSFPISTSKWQVVMQMKQTGPSANSGGTPVLALEAREGKWVLTQSDSPGPSGNTHEVWSTPATLGQWTDISLDVTYSPDPSQGKVQISVGGVSSPTFTTFTQKYETSPGGQGLSPGDAIPSHLRMGIYHDPSLPGTSVDFSDVRVSS